MTQQITVPTSSLAVSERQSAAWLTLAAEKNSLVVTLGSMELQAQAILTPFEKSEDYNAIDTALVEFRKKVTEISDTRKGFTNKITDGIVTPLMDFEKRVAAFELYATLKERSLQLRQAEAAKVAEANRRNAEMARLKSFIENEFYRIAAEYRGTLLSSINAQYRLHLEQKMPPDLTKIKDLMALVSIPNFRKFGETFLTDQDKQLAFSQVRQPNYQEIFLESCNELERVFANFDSDLANAEAAIAHQQEQAELQRIQAENELQQQQAITNLVVAAETPIIEAPHIKKTLVITGDETEQWAVAVMSAFIINRAKMTKYIRVKSWAKLSIEQMANYLGKFVTDNPDVKLPNLQIKEVEQ